MAQVCQTTGFSMKFYKDKSNNYNFYWSRIKSCKLTSIYVNNIGIDFFKNGIKHNTKNAAYISDYKYIYKEFYLNDKFYGDQTKFTKYSWRKFVKLQVLL